MPFIEVAVADVKESEAVPEGVYDLRAFSAEVRDSKKGKPMLVVGVSIESADFPNAAPVSLFLSLPNSDDEPRAAEFKKLQIARFLHTFNVPHEDTGFDPDDIPGCTAEEVKVGQRLVEEDANGQKLAEPFTVNEIQLKRLPRGDDEEVEAVDTKMKKQAGAKRRR